MNDQKWLSKSFLAYFFTWGVFMPYWTGWLTLEKGLSITEASIVMGTGMIARTFSTFLIFPFLSKRMALVQIMKYLALISLGFTLLYIPSSTFSLLLIITLLFSLAYPIILPTVESSATLLMQSSNIHYGKSRSFGSIGYTIALLIVGGATAIWDEGVILYIMIAGLGIIFLFSMQAAPASLTQKPIQSQDDKRGHELKKLLSMKSFVIILGLAILLQGAHASYYNYGYLFLSDLGVNSFYIGIILNIAVLFEILFFTQVDKFFGKMNISTMFLIAGIASTTRWMLIFLFPFTSIFIATQLFHALSFGVTHYAFIHYISDKLPKALLPTAQGMYAAFATSLSIAFLTIFGGYLYDISPNLAFLGMISCTIPAIIIILFTKKKFSY